MPIVPDIADPSYPYIPDQHIASLTDRRAAAYFDFQGGINRVAGAGPKMAAFNQVIGGSFTGGANGTTVRSDGSLTSIIPINTPRLSTKGLYIEGSGSNILGFTTDLSNATNWSRTNAFVQVAPQGDGKSPDRSLTAVRIINDSGITAYSRITRSVTITPASLYTGACFFKQAVSGGNSFAFIDMYDGTDKYAIFNIVTGVVVTTTAGVSARIVRYGDGWWRAECTITAAASPVTFAVGPSSGVDVSCASGNFVLAFGPSFNLGDFALLYIPQATATIVTHTADVARITVPAATFTPSFTLVVWADMQFYKAQVLINVLAGADTTNRIDIRRNSGGDFSVGIIAGGVTYQAIYAPGVVVGPLVKVAMRVRGTSFMSCINGILSTETAYGTLSPLTNIQFGEATGITHLQSFLTRCRVYNNQWGNVTDAQLIRLTQDGEL